MIASRHFLFFLLGLSLAIFFHRGEAQPRGDTQGTGISARSGEKRAAPVKLSAAEQRFLREAAQAGAAEVERARIAAGKAQSAAVRKLAASGAGERSRLLEELRALAAARGVEVPAAPDRDGRAANERMAKMKGLDFDRRYLLVVMKDLDRELRLARRAARQAKDRDVAALAAKHEKLIEAQLERARRVAAEDSRIIGRAP